MIKVLERLALRIAIVVLCFMYIEWSPLILLVGVCLVYFTNAPAPQRQPGTEGQLSGYATLASRESAAVKRVSPPGKKRRSSQEDDQAHESEEDFLARERYEEWCKDH